VQSFSSSLQGFFFGGGVCFFYSRFQSMLFFVTNRMDTSVDNYV